MTDYTADALLETETGHEIDPDQFRAMPVCITEPVVTEEITPQDAQTYTLAISTAIKTDEGIGVAELLPKDSLRVLARILAVDQDAVICHSRAQANDAANAALGASIPSPAALSNFGNVTSPAALQTIVSLGTVPAGTYDISGFSHMGGTPAAVDADNIQLVVGAGTPIVLPQSSSAGAFINFGPIRITVPAGGATVLVQAIVLATAGAAYRVSLIATPVSPAQSTTTFPTGAYLPKGIERQIRTTRRMWIAAISASPNRISVITERRRP